MEWNKKLQVIINEVEQKLQQKKEPIDIAYIMHIAGCSFPFFQKIFSYMNGITFANYVRSRKLTLAGYDLKSTKATVLEIALSYGYESPTSFTKAFQQFHGVTPREARKANITLQVYPKMQISNPQTYTWDIKHIPAKRMIGKCITLSFEDGEHYKTIPAFWSTCQKDGTYANLIKMDGAKIKGLYGVFLASHKASKKLEYALMVESDCALVDDYIEVMIPNQTWVIFDCIGIVPSAIHNAWNYIHEEWLLKYPFQHGACYEMEWYSDGNVYDPTYKSQIWIPIKEE